MQRVWNVNKPGKAAVVISIASSLDDSELDIKWSCMFLNPARPAWTMQHTVHIILVIYKRISNQIYTDRLRSAQKSQVCVSVCVYNSKKLSSL